MQPEREKTTRSVVGIVLVDKPAGLTSNQVLHRAKRLFRARKAGHTGTLDPMATGMLPVCFGAATKVSGMMLDSRKRYRVTATFGSATDTGDATGTVTDTSDGPALAIEAVRSVVGARKGRSLQVPPMYSAVKHQGRRLYELARQGREVPREPREIEIYELTIEAFEWPDLTLAVHCSKGTYVRTVITDIAADLGTVAHVSALRRLSVEPFDESQMVSLERLESAAAAGVESLDRWLLGADAALVDVPAIEVGAEACQALRYGQVPRVGATSGEGKVRVYDPSGQFIGIGHLDGSGGLRPARIFPC